MPTFEPGHLPRQRRHQQAPGVPGLRPAVHQRQRRAVASDDRVQAQLTGVDVSAGEGVGEPDRQVRRPETEPGPSGVGNPMDDELMTIPLTRPERLPGGSRSQPPPTGPAVSSAAKLTGRGFIGGDNQHTNTLHLQLRLLSSGIVRRQSCSRHDCAACRRSVRPPVRLATTATDTVAPSTISTPLPCYSPWPLLASWSRFGQLVAPVDRGGFEGATAGRTSATCRCEGVVAPRRQLTALGWPQPGPTRYDSCSETNRPTSRRGPRVFEKQDEVFLAYAPNVDDHWGVRRCG